LIDFLGANPLEAITSDYIDMIKSE
jgi:hypothetical protein